MISTCDICTPTLCVQPVFSSFIAAKRAQVIDRKNQRRVRNAKVEGSIPFRSTSKPRLFSTSSVSERAPFVLRSGPIWPFSSRLRWSRA
jgi:hypothetical protein